MKSFYRYPGSKAKIVEPIKKHFPECILMPLWQQSQRIEYREPFFGCGAMGLDVIEGLPPSSKIWINDKDRGVHCIWKCVLDPIFLRELCDLIKSTVPSVDLYKKCKAEDGKPNTDWAKAAHQKLVLHQTSFSGLGMMSGGPIGGMDQSSEYNVGCRWNPTTLCLSLRKAHALFKRFSSVRVTYVDFEKLVVGATSDCFVYLDPPYYEKGPELYQHSMNDSDHVRLSEMLRGAECQWVLSYDEHERIRELYSWADIIPIDVRYTTAIARDSKLRRKNSEVVIKPRRSSVVCRRSA